MTFCDWPRRAALLAISLLFSIVWGFAGIGKVIQGRPAWFADKFGGTFLAKFPGLGVTFWILTASEIAAFALALVSLARLEFLRGDSPVWLRFMLAGSLFVWLQLSFGQWLTNDFNATAQLFAYFAGTVVCLHFVGNPPAKT